jgi:hypothetical protein
MKAKYKYFLPVLIFLFAWVSSFFIVFNRRNTFTKMLDKAGSEQLPIIWVRSVNQSVPDWYISTIDKNAVKLVPVDVRVSVSNIIFTDDGVIRISTCWSDNPGSAISFWNIQMPDIYAQKDSQIIQNEFNMNSFLSQEQGEKYVAIYNPNGIQIEDFGTGETSYIQIINLPPSYSGFDQLSSGEMKIDSALTTIIYKEGNWGERCIIWRYDISDGTWTEIIRREFIPFFSVGPNARIIGLKFDRSGPSESIFIDGHTGETLHTIYGMDKFIIGQKWIACSEGVSGNQRGIVLIDMENNWEEHRLTFPCDSYHDFAMYEPPEGGVEEMLRMRGDI